MKLSLFKRTQHKTFHHIPIYYDEKAERMKEMERQAKVELAEEQTDSQGEDTRNYRERLKGSMRRFEHQHQSTVHFASNQKRRSNLRIIVIMSILFLVAYLLWTHTETFVQAFMKR